MSEEESDAQDLEVDRTLQMSHATSLIGHINNSDFFFGDCDLDHGFDYEGMPVMTNGQVYDRIAQIRCKLAWE